MMQMQSADNVVQVLGTLVQASSINSADASRLTALVQSSQAAQDDDDTFGAPDVAAYKNKSGGIIDTLGDLLEKAEGQLADARKKETNALNAFQMVEQSLKDEIKVAKKGTSEAKKGLAECGEKKATAEGDLDVTSKALAKDSEALGDLHEDCMTKAQDFEAETTSRGEELAALAKAKEIIIEATGGAASFVQVAQRVQRPARSEAVRMVRELA